ncbi:MAG: hypothetical protein M3439_11445 [Chloroflexota bacterium]|nr:hypothetical protein [Chloroflexota bacterium]
MIEARDDGSGRREIASSMRHWRAEHPQATLTEIEREVDRQLDAVRADLVREMAVTGAAFDVCPDCGAPLVQRGTRERTLITDGDEPLRLQRVYASCPACGNGLFPPG